MSAVPVDAKQDAALAACLFAVDPAGLGGIVVRAGAGPARERFIEAVRAALAQGTPMRKMPANIGDDRLLGGLDLTATLQTGRPILARGLLAETEGGVVLVPMAERLAPFVTARLCAALDQGGFVVERDGLTSHVSSRLGLILLDEGIGPDESAPRPLLDRIAFHIGTLDASACGVAPFGRPAIDDARERLHDVRYADPILQALCEAALLIGVHSNRALLLALHVSRVHAALCGLDSATMEDAAIAARLVLAPRATVIPADPEQDAQEPPRADSERNENDDMNGADEMSDLVLDAVRAAIPAGLLQQLSGGNSGRARLRQAGQSGQQRASSRRGRPIGTRPGDIKAGVRLNIVETLQAAAPWQRLRRHAHHGEGAKDGVLVRREDFRITRFKQHSETLTIFMVDASGSSAVHRLAEAKGAVELLLADCYVRRDQVALLAFRGKGTELVLPPTRSLARAKRSLAAMPGGGATPLAAAIEGGCALAQAANRKGQTPMLVLLTDGRANIARDGTPGREKAEADALTAGRAIRSLGLKTLLVDTSQTPHPAARKLAQEMHAHYLPLPRADAKAISGAVRAIETGA